MKKKYASVFLIAGILAALETSVPLAAVNTSPSFDASRTGSITLVKLRENDGTMKNGNGLADSSVRNPGMKGIEFRAVRIAEYDTGNPGGAVGTYFTSLDAEYLGLLKKNGISVEDSGGGLYTGEAIDVSLKAMRRIAGKEPGEEAVNSFVREHASVVFPKTGPQGSTTVSDLPLGLYLVAETDASGYKEKGPVEGASEVAGSISGPFLIALPMTNQGKTGKDGPGTVWQYDVTAYPKNAVISIPKYIVSEEDQKTLLQCDDREIGETVAQVMAPCAPAVLDGGEYETYVIKDSMEKGLAFLRVTEVRLGAWVPEPASADDFSSFTVLKEGTDYSVSGKEGGHSFSVTLLKSGLKRLNNQKANSQVAVFFESRLTKEASDGQAAANTNQPSLTWKHTGSAENTVKGNIPGIFSYHIDVLKKGLTDASKAVFRIRREGEKSDAAFVMESSGVYHFFDETNDDASARTSDLRPAANGELKLRGFDEGSYEFRETGTGSGHELLKSPILISLAANAPKDGNLASAAAVFDKKKANLTVKGGTAAFAVDNHSSLILKTGGGGKVLWYAIGTAAALMAAIPFLRQYRRRKDRGQEEICP